MPNRFQNEDQDLEIQEYEVVDGPDTVIPELAETELREEEMIEDAKASVEENKYGWAFFLCSLMIGVGLTATTGQPLPIFIGLGIGFLFFVDPIYQRVMDLFE